MATTVQSHQDLCPTCDDPTARHCHDGRCVLCPCGWTGQIPDFMRRADLSRVQAALKDVLQTEIAARSTDREHITVDGSAHAGLALRERTAIRRAVNDVRTRRGLAPVTLSAIIEIEAATGGASRIDAFARRCAELAIAWSDR